MDDDKIFAFVLMPFDAAFDDVYKFGIKEAATQLGITAERVDEQLYREGILERIYAQIAIADIIIADMSGQNPNVFYEVGYAHAKDKLCIMATTNAQDIPFDLKHRRHVVYGDSINTLRTRMSEELSWTKDEIRNARKNRIRVSLHDFWNNLHKTQWRATAEISFKADLHNDSDNPSAEIEGAYLYTGEGWNLHQDGRECPSTDSDVLPFKKRHFLNLPIRRLHRRSWAQIKFDAKKLVAWVLKGEELKDSYRVAGLTMLRLVTSEGSLDYKYSIDVTVDEIPF